ncbi:hypothetical protein D9M70_543390 [compost metagenome]
MQAQDGAGLAGHHIGRGAVVIDETDLAGALARQNGAHRAVVQGTQVDHQPPAQHQVEVLVAVERRKHDFTRLQITGAEFLEQLLEIVRGDILEQP